MNNEHTVHTIGVVKSPIKTRAEAPKQGSEGAPDVWLDMSPTVAQGLDGIGVGSEIIVVMWFHLSRRDVLNLHPRSDRSLPLAGVLLRDRPIGPIP